MKPNSETVKDLLSKVHNNEITSDSELSSYLTDIFRIPQSHFHIVSRQSLAKLPLLKHKHFVIINLDTERGAGTHWVTLIRLKNRLLYYDSFAIPCGLDVYRYASRHKNCSLSYSDSSDQAKRSRQCGIYVIKFIVTTLI